MCITENQANKCMCGQKTKNYCRLLPNGDVPPTSYCQHEWLAPKLFNTTRDYQLLLDESDAPVEVATCQECAREIYRSGISNTRDYACELKTGTTIDAPTFQCYFIPDTVNIFNPNREVHRYLGQALLMKTEMPAEDCHKSALAADDFK